MPRFSVVIPAYNAERTIAQTIGSVTAQSAIDLELVVVDDGSADATPAIVAGLAEDDPRVRLVEQPNAGTAGARNTGIRETSADYVSFLDNDDLWMPTYLDRMGAALDAEADAGFAYCDAWSLDDATLRIRRRTELQSRPAPAADASWEGIVVALARANFVMSSATVRREALEQVEGFHTDVFGVDDYDLWLRILLSGRGAVLVAPEPLLLQRDRADSQSKDDPMMTEGLRRVIERALADKRLPEAARQAFEDRTRAIAIEQGHGGRRGSVQRATRRMRAAAVSARDTLLGERIYMDRPPPTVLAAFPELSPKGPDQPPSATS